MRRFALLAEKPLSGGRTSRLGLVPQRRLPYARTKIAALQSRFLLTNRFMGIGVRREHPKLVP